MRNQVSHQFLTSFSPVSQLFLTSFSAVSHPTLLRNSVSHPAPCEKPSFSPVSHQFLTSFSPVSHQFLFRPLVSHQFLTSFSPVSLSPFLVSHQFLSSFSPVSHQFLTSFSQVSHQFLTSFSPVSHQFLSSRRLPALSGAHSRSVTCKDSAHSFVPMGTLSKSDAAWYQKRFNLRCARIAEIINRPAFRFLQEAGKVPHPPHAGLACGQRSWDRFFRTWRDYGFSLAVLCGFVGAVAGSQKAQSRVCPGSGRAPGET